MSSSTAARNMSAAANVMPPAVTTVRGFHTPVTSGDEDSDYGAGGVDTPQHHYTHTPTKTPKHVLSKLDDVVSETISAGSSPMLRGASSPGLGGISKLKLQLETLNLENESGSGSRASSMTFGRSHSRSHLRSQPQSSTGTMTSDGSDDDSSDVTSYEIPLEHDFVSADADAPKSLFSALEGGLVKEPAPQKMTATDFEPLRCLGKGTYGTVLLVKQQTSGRLFAQKQFKKASLTIHKKLVEQTKTERAILESVNRHPFVVKLFYAFQDQEKLYLILEYAQGGELFTHLAQERMFTEEVASFYMAEMVLALEHLHTNLGVVYRDLKPENCLLDAEGHLLLTDFGLSKVAVDDDDHCNSILGTVEYMAPEVVEGKKYGFAVDWWSLGALGFDLLTGAPPFQGNNHAKIQEKILKSKLIMPYFLGPDAKDLLTRLLRKEPNKRLGASMPKDLGVIKKHRFFRKIDWRLLAKRELEAPIQPLITDPELAENFSAEFTDLPLSPVFERGERGFWGGRDDGVTGPLGIDMETPVSSSNPFGGFSYVASSSLLEGNGFDFRMAV